jgi:peroxiredoxin
MEQLNAFAPAAKKFSDAGINLIAVSTDSIDGLSKTFDTETKPFPFPLLADPSLVQFKAYRAYDDFEEMALHGTFLIDGSSRIRWQEISYEPFMHPDWLLEECVRLLELTSPAS